MPYKRNQFWNFFISFVPGAGQMYQGFLKRGTSLMSAFFAEILLAEIVNIDWLLLGLPVIWAYAFFDSINTNSLPDEDFNKLKDGYLFTEYSTSFKVQGSKLRIPAAVVLILMGSYILLQNIVYMLRRLFGYSYHWWLMDLVFDYLPRFVFAAAVITAGLYLIKGKKIQMDNDDTYTQDKDIL
ncbi:MAG: hypothetical protein K1W24_12205 [Lachnospiraceae bacterium]